MFYVVAGNLRNLLLAAACFPLGLISLRGEERCGEDCGSKSILPDSKIGHCCACVFCCGLLCLRSLLYLKVKIMLAGQLVKVCALLYKHVEALMGLSVLSFGFYLSPCPTCVRAN
jgi:hypothetical protein